MEWRGTKSKIMGYDMEQGRGDELKGVWGRYKGEGIWRMGGKGWQIEQREGIGWGTMGGLTPVILYMLLIQSVYFLSNFARITLYFAVCRRQLNSDKTV